MKLQLFAKWLKFLSHFKVDTRFKHWTVMLVEMQQKKKINKRTPRIGKCKRWEKRRCSLLVEEMGKENYKEEASVFIAAARVEMMVRACQSQYLILDSHALIQTLIWTSDVHVWLPVSPPGGQSVVSWTAGWGQRAPQRVGSAVVNANPAFPGIRTLGMGPGLLVSVQDTHTLSQGLHPSTRVLWV